jgi:thiol-disulfide isomerase/thioredoxin
MTSHILAAGSITLFIALAAPAVRAADDTVAKKVTTLEERFLQEIQSGQEVEQTCADFERHLLALVEAHPLDPAPYVGLTELFEKCDPERTRRVVALILARPALPEKIRPAFERVQRMTELVGGRPELELKSMAGSPVRLGAYRGKVVILDFWATWCGPCVKELPKLAALRQEYQTKGLDIVSVSYDQDRAKLDAFLKRTPLPWAQVHATGEQREYVTAKLAVTGGMLPTVYLVGRDGRIRHTTNSRFELRRKVEVLLAEPVP